MVPDIAIGAIAAALIGAIISLVGLIVAKEGKVSEFRQAWIDSLRTELSTFLASVNAVADARGLTFKDSRDRYETLQPSYDKLNETYYLIALRLNSKENESGKLKDCMVEISQSIMDPDNFDFVKFEEDRVKFINISNSLLKSEWNRVKHGEPVYRSARILATLATLALVVAAIAVTYDKTIGFQHASANVRSPDDKTKLKIAPTPKSDMQISNPVKVKPS